MAGFNYVKSRQGGNDIPRKVQIGASVTVTAGDLLKISNGKFIRLSAATETPVAVAVETATSTATSLTEVSAVDVVPYGTILEVPITPLLNDAAVVSATTTSVTCAQSAGSSNDMVGGLVYVNGQTRIITANSYSGGNNAITFVEPLASAPAVGDLVRAVPYGFGTAALKLNSSTMYNALSNAIADITGGKVSVFDVNLAYKTAQVFFIP